MCSLIVIECSFVLTLHAPEQYMSICTRSNGYYSCVALSFQRLVPEALMCEYYICVSAFGGNGSKC